MTPWNPNDFLYEGSQWAFSITTFQSSHPLSALKPNCIASFPKAWGSGHHTSAVIWDEVNNALVFVDRLLAPSLPSHRRSMWGKPYPLKYSHLVNSNCQNSRFRKAAESWAAAQELWWRESLQGGKVLESSSTSPLAVPSCWGSRWSWAAWAGCLGDSTGALHTETQLVEQTRRWVWSKKEKRRDILWNPSWPEHSIQNSSIILHSHLIFLDDAILQLSRE